LRTAQNFDALHVVEFGFEQVARLLGRVVQVDADAGVSRASDGPRADTADLEVEAVGEVALGEADIGNGQLKIRTPVDLLGFQRVLAERGHRDRHVLKGFFLLLGRDDQLFDDRSLLGVGLLGESWGGDG